jgi:very-short-patch-repair endonuclease
MRLCNLGHLARTGTLRASGYSRDSITRALASGEIVRLRRGTYGCAHVDAALALAARHGGALSCVSVLRELGVWAGHDQRVHVQLPPTTSRAAVGAVSHWSAPRFGLATPWRVSTMEALWQAMHCLDEEHAIAAMESAVAEHALTRAQVMRLGLAAPRRLQHGIHQLEFSSGSGNETIVRRRLRAAGFSVVAQGKVPGLGRQDLVVEQCVALEIDSARWHGDDQTSRDRDRDRISEYFGRRVLRISPSHVHATWPHTLGTIERMVADAQRARR